MNKKIILLFIAILFITTLSLVILLNINFFNDVYTNINMRFNKKYDNLVFQNGFLKVDGNNLKNQKGENIQLKGLSSHGIQWYSDMINYSTLKQLRDDWGVNVFRISLYTLENGYIYKPELKEKVTNFVDILIELNMYTIIDWHILSDGNPNIYKTQSKEFFDEISKKYKNSPNVIYEICNEPNGNVTWDNDIKPYAEEIIPIIRKNNSKSLIIVGTPNWSQDVDIAADNPLQFPNITYALHFYAGAHEEDLRKKVDYALSKNISIFASEWGVSDLQGDGKIYIDESNKWINYLKEKNISWVNWSFSTKEESSAILLNNYNTSTDPNINNYLTPSGIYIKSIINTRK